MASCMLLHRLETGLGYMNNSYPIPTIFNVMSSSLMSCACDRTTMASTHRETAEECGIKHSKGYMDQYRTIRGGLLPAVAAGS